MCDATFTFGQRGSHFFQSPSYQHYTRLPPKLTTLLTSPQLSTIHHVTLGFSDSFLLTYRDKAGADHITSHGLPQELNDFIYAVDTSQRLLRNIPKLRLTLGPYNTSFFVHDASAYLWMNLPARLLTALQSRIKSGTWSDRPRLVALGADDNFVLLTEKHAAVWDLPYYRTVSSMLEFSRSQEKGIQEVLNIVLHAYRYQCFVALSRNGTVLSDTLPQQQVAALEAMRAPLLRDIKEGERRGEKGGLERRLTGASGRRQSAGTRESGIQWSSDMRRDNIGTQRENVPPQRRPSNLQRQAELRRDWGDHTQEFKAQARGLKLSLSLSVSAGGLAKIWAGKS